MTGKIGRSDSKAAVSVIAVACLLGSIAGAHAESPAVHYISELDPQMIWQILIGGFVALAFLAAIVLWVASALRNVRREQHRRNAFVGSALNHLGQGIVMLDDQKRVVFCNDRYLEIYDLTRADITKDITGPELRELRRQRGKLDLATQSFYEQTVSAGEYIAEMPGGQSVHVKFSRLPNGGAIGIHEDCTEQRFLQRELATTKQFLESVLDHVPICVAAKTIDDGRYIFANRAFETFSRLSRDKIVGKRPDQIFSAQSAKAIAEADALAVETRSQCRSEFNVEIGSDLRTLDSNRVIAFNERNEPAFLIALFEDVTDRKSLSKELENAKKFLETVLDNIPVSLMVQQISTGRYLFANRGAEVILGRKREDAIGLTVPEMLRPEEAKLIVSRDQAAIRGRTPIAEEHPISTRDGLRLFLTRRVTVLDEAGEPQYLIKTHEDVTDRRQTEARMAHMAYHDGLTDLPNRPAFLQALSQMIDACGETSEEFAVLSIDLDGLKEVNDVFGHAIGDKLLIEVSRRVDAAVGGGVVARLGGDEFGVIIDGAQPAAGLLIAERISAALAEEFPIEGKSVRTGVTTGISLFPRDGHDPAALLANSGAALFRAKSQSRGSISIFEPQMDQQLRDRRVLHQDLSAAIRNGELSLHYQPQARAGQTVVDADITGFEALARWIHPTRGFVPPGDFIPLAEESGLIVEMGEWILRQACLEAASWPVPLQIAVNLSPAQFMHGDLVGLVHSILLETGLQPGRLELEITEGVLIEDFDRGVALLRRLKALGVRISMDDFGSGYSSLTYLQAFPFDKIKIDRAFVINLGLNPQSAAIVRAVIGLGHGLDVAIVAEGVETHEQLCFLASEGCDGVQGYFIGRPAPIAQYAALVGRIAAAAPAARMVG
ncbi:sensor domain-containing protein [Tardiphaga sp. 1201_B9_N1_1]|jgi:diguanylate cyclase (GGDEF)-like protein/PAS domain S-box-containing protein|uniref:EAL domain-containing protein n=1 Tax=Tardiphaga robiniae TaxID=943830 RepID=A0A7G6U2E1_9BRAD|nr:EAL domain-containing protein [Tardiphaga robiniae]MDR6658949.1 diguanylate cyclase (GGDEF)-like protein/PAS domain S-box-containing protein [Tardiphaga robiniae]NUU42817.1 EAL domain-containing protein [Tardiphaga robiniae]QND73173.1 EAL domain-containing protein [Tardiphaga robiniae]